MSSDSASTVQSVARAVARVVARAVAFGGAILLTSAVTRRYGKSIQNVQKNIQNVQNNIPFRPPGWVFGVAWSVLFVTTGAAWVVAKGRAKVPLSVVTLLCCAWLVVYTVLEWTRVVAPLTLAATVVATVSAAVVLRGVAGWLLAPLAVWTAFATYLNAFDAFYAFYALRADQ